MAESGGSPPSNHSNPKLAREKEESLFKADAILTLDEYTYELSHIMFISCSQSPGLFLLELVRGDLHTYLLSRLVSCVCTLFLVHNSDVMC